MNVAVDPEVLTDLAITCDAGARAMTQHHDDLTAQRAHLVGRAVAAPPGGALPALADIARRWRLTAAALVELRGHVVGADQWTSSALPQWGPPALGTRPWSYADVARVVELGHERARLGRDRAEGGRVDREAARLGLDPVEGELARLANRFDRAGWQAVAHHRAGFDHGRWDPSRGLAYNDANVRAVYTFYGDLYLDDPDLHWAGLAALVGRQLYAGWQDLHTGRQLLDDGDRARYAAGLLGLPTGPDWIYDGVDLLTNLHPATLVVPDGPVSRGLDSLETEMLHMVSEIFHDMGWMHVAYLYGGSAAVTAALSDSRSDNELALAWKQIGGDEADEVRAGNTALAFREQGDIIGDNWDDIRADSMGWLLTPLLTQLAENPVPGGRPFREVATSEVDLPALPFVLPRDPYPFLPDIVDPTRMTVGDVSVFDHRWQYFTEEVEPAFQRLRTDQPDLLDSILRSTFAASADEQRRLPLPYDPDGPTAEGS